MRKITKISMTRRSAKAELLANEFKDCYTNFCKKHEKYINDDNLFSIDFGTFTIALSVFTKFVIDSYPSENPEIIKKIKTDFLETIKTIVFSDIDFYNFN